MATKVTPEEIALILSKNILNVHEAAVLMGRSEKTIRNRISEIPHYYGPFGVFFKRTELESWLCQVKCTPTTI